MNRKRAANGFAKAASFLCVLLLPLCALNAAKKGEEPKATSIPLPAGARAKARSVFSDIKPRIIDLIEDGSPRSLEVAARLMHHSDVSAYTDNEKTLLQACALMMEFCWPSYQANWNCPDIRGSNYYTNVMFSVRNGVYEAPASDELIANLLPCLCLFSAPKNTACYASVAASLEKVLGQKSASVAANYMMAALLNRQGKNAKSLTHLRLALEKDSSNKDILALQMKVCIALGRYDEALATGDKLLAADPQSLPALELCCDAYYAKGDMVRAGDLAAQILMLDSRNGKYLLVRAETAMDGGDYVKASTLLDAYSRGGKSDKSFYLLRSRLQSEWNKSPASAGETLGQALLKYPDDTELMLAAAKVASDGDMKLVGKTALEFARAVLKKDKSNKEALRVCIAELAKEGSYEEAYALSSGFKGDVAVLHDHIAICLGLGKNDEARELALSFYNKNRSDPEAQKSYLKVLVATGRKAEAEEMIASLMDGADTALKSFLYYEKSFLGANDKEAVACLRSSLTQNPRNTDALTRLYEIYYEKQDWKRAQYYLKQVVALNPSNKKALAMSKKLDKIINN